MIGARQAFDKDDVEILEDMKKSLTAGIEKLKERNVRTVNIDIELNRHIRKELKGEQEDY